MNMIDRFLDRLEKRYSLAMAKQSDLGQIVQIYAEVWSDNSPAEKLLQRFHTRYSNNPISRGLGSIVICRDKDRIIGFAGMLDFQISYHGNAVPAAYSIDLAILAPYQALGIGILLLNALRKRNIVAMDGNMNAEARNLAEQMGARMITDCFYLRRWLRPADAFRRWKHSTFTVENGARIDERFDKLWQAAAEDCEIIGIRDHNVLQWRFEEHPSREFITYTLCHERELVAYIIATIDPLKGGVKKGILVDYLFAPRSYRVINDFILYVLGALARSGTVFVDTIATRKYFPENFKELGFYPKSEAPDFMIYPNQLTEGKTELWDGKNWHLTFGDSDYYLP